MSRTIQTCSRAAAAVNNPETASAADTRHAAALSALTSNRHSPDSVSQFRSFSNRGPLTPTPHRAPRVTTEVFGDGPGDDGPDDNGPGDGGPSDDNPNGDDPDGDYPDLGDEDNDLVDLPEQDDPGMTILTIYPMPSTDLHVYRTHPNPPALRFTNPIPLTAPTPRSFALS